MKESDTSIDVLEVIDRILSAALREVRSVRARQPIVELPEAKEQMTTERRSQVSVCIDILKESGRPMHISALLAGLEGRGVRATRESLVSALSKQLAPLGKLLRTAPNTFGLASRDHSKEV
jgi:hypothetical protein